MANLLNARPLRAERGHESRFLTGSFESIAWRYGWCRDKSRLATMQAAGLVLLIVLLVVLALRTQRLMAAPSAPGGLGALMAVIVVVGLVSAWLVWRLVRQLLALRRELNDLAARAEYPVE